MNKLRYFLRIFLAFIVIAASCTQALLVFSHRRILGYESISTKRGATIQHRHHISMITDDQRVVVTGLGVISPVGLLVPTFFDNICNGVSGISNVDRFDATPFKCQIGGQIRDFDPKNYYNSRKKIKQNDLYCHYAVGASHMALKDAGINLLGAEK